jgi:hypothetical protein
MSCPKDLNATQMNKNIGRVGYNSNAINNITMTNSNRAQYNDNLTQNNPNYILSNCRKISKEYPSFTPEIFSLSTTSSKKGSYSVVYINGSRFLPTCIGNTYVNFGPYTNLPITYFSSNSLSFIVPLNAKVGNYSVVVVNVYNGNFSPQVNTSNPGDLNVSNAISYTIT